MFATTTEMFLATTVRKESFGRELTLLANGRDIKSEGRDRRNSLRLQLNEVSAVVDGNGETRSVRLNSSTPLEAVGGIGEDSDIRAVDGFVAEVLLGDSRAVLPVEELITAKHGAGSLASEADEELGSVTLRCQSQVPQISEIVLAAELGVAAFPLDPPGDGVIVDGVNEGSGGAGVLSTSGGPARGSDAAEGRRSGDIRALGHLLVEERSESG